MAMQVATQAATDALVQLTALLGPPQAAEAAEATAAASEPGLWEKVSAFFFDPRLQWDENGNILLDPQGNPLPDNLWTQFVAFQATLIKRLDEAQQYRKSGSRDVECPEPAEFRIQKEIQKTPQGASYKPLNS